MMVGAMAMGVVTAQQLRDERTDQAICEREKGKTAARGEK